MVNRNGTPESLGVIPLAEGEFSRPVRVRAAAWVFEALSGRSAAEVGKLLESALRDTNELVAPMKPVMPIVLIPSTALRDSPVVQKRPTSELSTTLWSIVASLKAGAVAEYDHRERKWMVSDKGGAYPVYKRDLEKLVKAELIQEKDGRYRAK